MKSKLTLFVLSALVSTNIYATDVVNAFNQTVAEDFGQRTEGADLKDSIMAIGDTVILVAGVKVILKPRYLSYREHGFSIGGPPAGTIVKEGAAKGPARVSNFSETPFSSKHHIVKNTGYIAKTFAIAGIVYSVYDLGTRAYLFAEAKDSDYLAGVEVAKGTCNRVSEACQSAISTLNTAIAASR